MPASAELVEIRVSERTRGRWSRAISWATHGPSDDVRGAYAVGVQHRDGVTDEVMAAVRVLLEVHQGGLAGVAVVVEDDVPVGGSQAVHRLSGHATAWRPLR
ncbi:hypothetical protein [Streptomyces coffeae]|uniref:GNAT family N-acetyltransferase n=1 Tax=Streptomyces coffeae TaxID=621382 RepID=A0ABS1NKN8_9ACTN|nr:hypothetical protein [Streptomyces coffeae]MBL1100606.1 hypothetical protein [Streptomyces coffeae]